MGSRRLRGDRRRAVRSAPDRTAPVRGSARTLAAPETPQRETSLLILFCKGESESYAANSRNLVRDRRHNITGLLATLCNGGGAAPRIGGTHMKAMTPAVALVLAVSVSAGPALADDNGTAGQQGDCMGDALAWGGHYIFRPDRNLQIGDCLWEHPAQISGACRSHLGPPKKPAPRNQRL